MKDSIGQELVIGDYVESPSAWMGIVVSDINGFYTSVKWIMPRGTHQGVPSEQLKKIDKEEALFFILQGW